MNKPIVIPDKLKNAIGVFFDKGSIKPSEAPLFLSIAAFQEMYIKGITIGLNKIDERVVKILKDNINSFSYRKFTTYDKTICQYDGRREVICSKCEEVCPTVAITKDDTTKTLTFSQVDCHGCGGCISVCPSGALDYTPTNKESLYEISKFYKETHPLIIPSKMSLNNLNNEILK